ncbi:MAG: MFS transporter [Lacunisphaera sp.]|nr:MFS transporter [Lacunisphaera sp.]
MILRALRWFRPAKHIGRLSGPEAQRAWPRYRWQVFEASFVGYAMFYVVRNNLGVVAKELGAALHYDKAMIGDILAGTAIAYGVGKLVMGFLSDRSDPRKFIFAGLLLTALCNFAFGASTSFGMHLALWSLNGLIQGMGYGPCARGLSHWYAAAERGSIFGVWNMAHNIGGGAVGVIAATCAHHFGWPSAFYVPGAIATVGACYLLWRMVDTPESVGLPPIEEHAAGAATAEPELTLHEIVVGHILTNRMLWLVAVANFFVYIARYSMLDWGPTYLKEVKGATLIGGGVSTLVIEFAGALGMLTMGWLSDRWGGRRGRVSVICLLPLIAAFAALRFTPPGLLWLDLALLGCVGFLVYVPVMMLGVMSLDLTSKKAVGTAAGFVGLFGYLGRVVQGKGLGWLAQHHGWDAALEAIVVCAALAAALLVFTWNVRPTSGR